MQFVACLLAALENDGQYGREELVVVDMEEPIAKKGVELKPAQIDITFVRTTKAQSSYINALHEKIKMMKMEATKRKQEKKKEKSGKSEGKNSKESKRL